MNSFNHYALGSVGEWMYTDVGGIERTSPGYKTFRIHPQPGGGIMWAKTGFDSSHGHIQCDWVQGKDGFQIDVQVPANTRAEVWIPGGKTHQVTVNGDLLKPKFSTGGKLIRKNLRSTVVEVGGGPYHFISTRSHD